MGHTSTQRLDPPFYRAAHPDLAHLSDTALRRHFRWFGRREGRPPNLAALLASAPDSVPDEFDEAAYRAANPDVEAAAAFPDAGLAHWVLFGRHEGRQLARADAVQPDFYGSYYGDLRGLDPSALRCHFEQHGRIEGRSPNAAALAAAITARTGRSLPEGFDEGRYLHAHPDVRHQMDFEGAGAVHYLESGQEEGRYEPWQQYDEHHLHLMTNRVLDPPDVQVVPGLAPRVNVLVPAFDFASMSAGFFGVFQTALWIARQGYRTRLVLFDNFAWDEQEMRSRLQHHPGLETLLDEVECDYIGERLAPLQVSPQDVCVATVWYSAWVARHIMDAVGGGPFLYLIQDYESAFYSASALGSLAEATYDFDYWALVSTAPLLRTLEARGTGRFARGDVPAVHFNNAATVAPPLLDPVDDGSRRRLAFYSRPQVHRNMFELGALALCRAVGEGALDPGEWDFVGIGLGEATVDLGSGAELRTLPRMGLADYQRTVATFDLGLTLMASPHPSLLPFDLAGSGAMVVTNRFGSKDQAYFDSLAPGAVLAVEPSLGALVEALGRAALLGRDPVLRQRRSESMTYPTAWSDTFGPEHEAFLAAFVAAARSSR